MKNKNLFRHLAITAVISVVVFFLLFAFLGKLHTSIQSNSVTQKTVESEISAEGSIHSVQETNLSFPLSGKLVYLPFKEGDQVSQGQTIAQLDTTALNAQLAQAVNSYKSVQDSVNQTSENQQAGVVEGQQRVSLDTTTKNSTYTNTTENTVIYDTVQRIIDQNQLSLNNASLSVTISQYALQLASLTAPFDGVITHEDVTTAGTNITPSTVFSVADPNNLVFRANVLASDIDFVSPGALVTVHLNGGNTKDFEGTVLKMYPKSTTLTDGTVIYQVDVQSPSLSTLGRLGQNGSVLIKSNLGQRVVLVPTWTVLSQTYLWVENTKNQPVLRQVTIGKSHGEFTEILGGLSETDRIILDPKTIGQLNYNSL